MRNQGNFCSDELIFVAMEERDKKRERNIMIIDILIDTGLCLIAFGIGFSTSYLIFVWSV